MRENRTTLKSDAYTGAELVATGTKKAAASSLVELKWIENDVAEVQPDAGANSSHDLLTFEAVNSLIADQEVRVRLDEAEFVAQFGSESVGFDLFQLVESELAAESCLAANDFGVESRGNAWPVVGINQIMQLIGGKTDCDNYSVFRLVLRERERGEEHDCEDREQRYFEKRFHGFPLFRQWTVDWLVGFDPAVRREKQSGGFANLIDGARQYLRDRLIFRRGDAYAGNDESPNCLALPPVFTGCGVDSFQRVGHGLSPK